MAGKSAVMIKMAFNLFYIVLLMLLFLGVIMGMCVTKNEHLLLHWGWGGETTTNLPTALFSFIVINISAYNKGSVKIDRNPLSKAEFLYGHVVVGKHLYILDPTTQSNKCR